MQLHCIKECREKDQPLDLVLKKEEKAAGRFKCARGLKALASVKWDGWIQDITTEFWQLLLCCDFQSPNQKWATYGLIPLDPINDFSLGSSTQGY